MKNTMRIFTLMLLAIACSTRLQAQVNWSEDIAPIVYEHCTKCHHYGGIGPFSLMAYTDVLNESDNVLDAVSNGIMPPWPANPDYQHFAFENVLSDAETQAIADWVAAGAPEGNPDLAPPMPVYNDASVLPNVDFTGQIGEYTSTASTNDEFRTFVIPANISVDKFIDAIEVLPSNPSIVHHVLVYYDPTTDCLQYDANDAGPGFSTTGTGGGLPPETKYLGVWVPGNSPSVLPQGFGFKVEAGGYYLVEIHFPEGSAGQADNTTINIHYSTASNPRQVFMDPILYHFTPVLEEGFIYIPANDTATFHESYTIPVGVSVFNVFPHMHLIGRTLTSWGETSSNQIIPFIDIDNWDFHWQYTYSFPSVRHVPANTTLKARAFYDNTAMNPHQPNDPPQAVYGGEETSNEMMIVFFTYAVYLPGDENIVIDEALSNSELTQPLAQFRLYPNPAEDKVTINLFTPSSKQLKCVIHDMQGREVFTQNSFFKVGMSNVDMDISALCAGLYVVTLQGDNYSQSLRIIIK
jgi:hypothetical protein